MGGEVSGWSRGLKTYSTQENSGTIRAAESTAGVGSGNAESVAVVVINVPLARVDGLYAHVSEYTSV